MDLSREPKRQREESLSPPPIKSRKVVESTTTKKAVSSFFTPVSKKEPDSITWRVVNDTLLFARYRPKGPSVHHRKVAAFDLDSTIIQTSSGYVFAKDATDWRWWDPVVPGELRKLNNNGYHICILTNQGSISTTSKTLKADAKSLSTFKTKVTAIFSHFDFPILLLAATARDRYRKPRTGMWMELLEELDIDDPDLEASFFVGDAGGRAATEKKADHSCSDRDLAANIGIDFQTPEEYFLNETPSLFTRTFEPNVYLDSAAPACANIIPISFGKTLDLVVMCGSPASGKSTFYWTKLKPLGYERVNQDILKSREKCVKVANSFLAAGTSVAIDNTNADTDTRAIWITLAAKYKVPARCVYLTAPVKLCEHNDTVRALVSNDFNPEKRTILPHSAFAGYASRFKEPKLSEGFQDIVKVPFVFQGTEEQKRVWCQYWI